MFLETFERNTSQVLAEMRQDWTKKDFDALKRRAHQLKPSIEMFHHQVFDIVQRINDNPEPTSAADLDEIEKSCKEIGQSIRTEFSV